MALKKLSLKHVRFVAEYLNTAPDYCGATAAKKVGYSEKTAAQQASRLLADPMILANLEHQRKAVLDEMKTDTLSTMLGLLGVAHFDPATLFDKDGNLLDIQDMPVEARRVITSVEVEERYEGGNKREGIDPDFVRTKKLKFADRLKAMDSVAIIQGLKKTGIFGNEDEKTKQDMISRIFLPHKKDVGAPVDSEEDDA